MQCCRIALHAAVRASRETERGAQRDRTTLPAREPSVSSGTATNGMVATQGRTVRWMPARSRASTRIARRPTVASPQFPSLSARTPRAPRATCLPTRRQVPSSQTAGSQQSPAEHRRHLPTTALRQAGRRPRGSARPVAVRRARDHFAERIDSKLKLHGQRVRLPVVLLACLSDRRFGSRRSVREPSSHGRPYAAH